MKNAHLTVSVAELWDDFAQFGFLMVSTANLSRIYAMPNGKA
ncbi:MAG: hypothetical protein V7K69_06430 [Nostoc sp.]